MDGTITPNVNMLTTNIASRINNPVEPLLNSVLLILIEIINISVPHIIPCIPCYCQ